MSSRGQLPDRGASVTRSTTIGGIKVHVTVGRRTADGAPGEVFIDAGQVGSAINCFAKEGAVLVSLLLQHGVPLRTVADCIDRAAQEVGYRVQGAQHSTPLAFAAHVLAQETYGTAGEAV